MKKLQLPEKALIQFFDLDIDNCLMTREDFCHCITDIMNNPKEIDYLFVIGVVCGCIMKAHTYQRVT